MNQPTKVSLEEVNRALDLAYQAEDDPEMDAAWIKYLQNLKKEYQPND